MLHRNHSVSSFEIFSKEEKAYLKIREKVYISEEKFLYLERKIIQLYKTETRFSVKFFFIYFKIFKIYIFGKFE